MSSDEDYSQGKIFLLALIRRRKTQINSLYYQTNATCIGFIDVDTISRLAQATILRANVQAGVPTLAGDSAISAHVSTFIVLVVEVVTGI